MIVHPDNTESRELNADVRKADNSLMVNVFSGRGTILVPLSDDARRLIGHSLTLNKGVKTVRNTKKYRLHTKGESQK